MFTTKKSRSCGKYEGIVNAIMAGVSFVIVAATMKVLQDFNPAELATYCSCFTIVYTLPVLIRDRYVLPALDKRTFLLWTIVLALSQLCTVTRIAAFQILPLGESSSIIFSVPIFTALLARIFLKERLSWMLIISLFLSLLGLLLTIRLPTLISSRGFGRNLHLIGYAYAFGSVFFIAGTLIGMRSLRHIPPLINTFVLSVGYLVLSACLAPAYSGFHQMACSVTLNSSLIVMGISGTLITYFTNSALQKEDATNVSILIRTSDIILSFVVQLLFFKEPVDGYSISGAFIVFLCGLLIPLQRWMENQSEDSIWRNSWLMK